MRRYLLVGLLLFAASAGCAEVVDDDPIPAIEAETEDEWDGHPDNHWQSEALTVAYEAPEDDRAYEPLVRDALEFWSVESERYLGYDLSLSLAADGEEPDIEIRFVEEIERCGETEDAYSAGCAPLYTDNRQIDRPAEVQVVTGYDDDSTAQVLKHELGHTLGLTHDDEPSEIMSAETELTTLPKTDAVDRDLPWQRAELTVFVDGATSESDEQIGAALGYFEDGADGTVPENVTFSRVAEGEEADIVISIADEDSCRSSPGSCGALSGVDLDGNGNFEYYERLEVTLVDLDDEVVAYHTGRWLARGFGAVEESEYPEPLRESATAEERRSEWWN
ncbi:MAG: matrixin family metalloprotease [Natronomonas sp.]